MKQKEYIYDINANIDTVCDMVAGTNRFYYFLKIPIICWLRDMDISYSYKPLENCNQIKFENTEDFIAFKLAFL